jgi:hypothetical protein
MTNPFQTMQPVERVYALPRCNLSLYADEGDGAQGSLIWTAKQVDDVQVDERFEEVEEFETGNPFPTIHHLNERHEINIGAIWNTAIRLSRNVEYILVATFQDATLRASPDSTLTYTWFGVTTSSRKAGSRNGNEFGGGIVLKAKRLEES